MWVQGAVLLGKLSCTAAAAAAKQSEKSDCSEDVAGGEVTGAVY